MLCLSGSVAKPDFLAMRVLGQFNLGFIIARLEQVSIFDPSLILISFFIVLSNFTS